MPGVRDYLRRQVESRWYTKPGVMVALAPLAWFYGLIAKRRKQAALKALVARREFAGESKTSPPIIVVGNIVAGGTGKTPIVMFVVEQLKALGARPGVVARGYGAQGGTWPKSVAGFSDPKHCGDEAVEMATYLGCPVVVSPDRVAAVAWLHEFYDCDVIVSDDGLQHYRMHRDLELAVVDAQRQHGNGRLLPVGPLREPVERLHGVDCVIETTRSCEPLVREIRSFKRDSRVPRLQASLRPVSATHLMTNNTVRLADAPFVGNACIALSAIGNPNRFHSDLLALGCTITQRDLADHDSYQRFAADWQKDSWVVTTGKDAVKLRRLGSSHAGAADGGKSRDWLDQVWVLNRQVVLPNADKTALDALLLRLLSADHVQYRREALPRRQALPKDP